MIDVLEFARDNFLIPLQNIVHAVMKIAMDYFLLPAWNVIVKTALLANVYVIQPTVDLACYIGELGHAAVASVARVAYALFNGISSAAVHLYEAIKRDLVALFYASTSDSPAAVLSARH
ncbi:MAG: hypothetical protein K1000chlam2_01582 [Chlamydiae bacterium]|nr:hypothetical protein [Chlamydiota bacterium]